MNQVVSSFLMMVKKFYPAIIVQIEVYKSKKPLKIKRLTTAIVHQIDLFSNQTIKLFEQLSKIL